MTYEDTLVQLAHESPALVVLTAENRAAIRNLPDRLGERFVDLGIAEQTMVGAAAGLALRGRIPIVHALAAFLTMRAFEFIRTDIGVGGLPVKLIGSIAGFLSEANGPTHQAIEDIGLMRAIPGMRIFCPADNEELVQGMRHVVQSPCPWYVRFNAMPPVCHHHFPLEPGSAEVLRDGSDVAILTYGYMVHEALVAGNELESRGLSVRLVNMRWLQPADERAILQAASETALLVTVEDHLRIGGLATIVSEVLTRRGVRCHHLVVALEGQWFRPALLREVLEHEGFTGKQIAHRIMLNLQTPMPHLSMEEQGSTEARYIKPLF